jgi:hypothetical protein
VHWTYDTWELGNGFARAIFERGGKKWYFISADYQFGKDLEAAASDGVKKLGGQVMGAVRVPLGTSDFSSFLIEAQSSGADTIALANAGGDLSNTLKQAAEYGLSSKFKLPGFVFQINNVKALGLQATQGVFGLMPFYWDQNDASRAFAKRFQELHPHKNMPNDMQAGVYSAMVPGCVKTSTRGERAELFSLFSSFDGACQSGSFLIQRHRDKRSTRKFDVGVFTQPGSFASHQPRAADFRSYPMSGHQRCKNACLIPRIQRSVGGIAIQNFGPLIRARGPSLSHISHSVSSQITRHGKD